MLQFHLSMGNEPGGVPIRIKHLLHSPYLTLTRVISLIYPKFSINMISYWARCARQLVVVILITRVRVEYGKIQQTKYFYELKASENLA